MPQVLLQLHFKSQSQEKYNLEGEKGGGGGC